MDKQYQIKRSARLCRCVLSAKKHGDPSFYIHRIGGWTDEAIVELENNLYQIAEAFAILTSMQAARALLEYIEPRSYRLTADTFGSDAEQAKRIIRDLRDALAEVES